MAEAKDGIGLTAPVMIIAGDKKIKLSSVTYIALLTYSSAFPGTVETTWAYKGFGIDERCENFFSLLVPVFSLLFQVAAVHVVDMESSPVFLFLFYLPISLFFPIYPDCCCPWNVNLLVTGVGGHLCIHIRLLLDLELMSQEEAGTGSIFGMTLPSPGELVKSKFPSSSTPVSSISLYCCRRKYMLSTSYL